MRGFRTVLLIMAIAGLFLLAINKLWSQPATSVPSVPQVTWQAVMENGIPTGEVLVGNTVVFRIHSEAGDYTAPERASVVASRLSTLLGEGYTWNSVRVGSMNNEVALLMGNNLLLTVDQPEARYNNSTRLNLATTWQQQVQVALGGTPTPIAGITGTTSVVPISAVAGTTESFPNWTNPATKIVPIINVGTPGVSIGAAQITGPAERVSQVKSVVQVQALFQRLANVYIFVPSSELAGMNRVQGVAVTALLDWRLFKL